jgi:serine/threonine protein kinase
MELCDRDLEIILKKREKGFSENELKIILIQLNIILYKMHIKQVIHRDIKLKNILIKFDDNIPLIGFIPKLSDFGFSKIVVVYITQTKLGTPATMAPEILMNKKYNTKADLWSLGIIIYQLLFKKFPFKARNERELLSIIMKSNSINIPHDSDNKISDCLIDLINNLLKKDQNDRIDFDSYFSHKFFEGVNLEDFNDNNNEIKEKENNLNLNLTFEERFSIIKKISNEFIGFNIFQAKDKLKGKLVYIKEFPKNIIDGNPIYKRIFDKEIELLKNLKGEQFIEFIDLFINESSYFIITENFEGKILDDFIKEKNGLNEDFVCKIFNQLIPSFKILNEKKIVLEFISCKSFSFKNFISEDNFKIKFFDYGISIIFSSEIERNNYLLNEGKLGNVIDPKTNILSLGLITYKMLFNDYIYKFNKNESINETIERQKSIKINKIISKNCKYFIEKMCHLQIEKRYDWNSFLNDSFINNKDDEKVINYNNKKNLKIQDKVIENILECLNIKISKIVNYFYKLINEGELNYLISNSRDISICLMLTILEIKFTVEFLKNKDKYNDDQELHIIKFSYEQNNNIKFEYSFINFLTDEVIINKENKMFDFYKQNLTKLENQLRDLLSLFSKKVNLDFGNNEDNLKNIKSNKNSNLGNLENYFFKVFEEGLLQFSKKEYEQALESLIISKYISEYIIFIDLISKYTEENGSFNESLQLFNNNNIYQDLKNVCFFSFIGGAIKTFKTQKIIEESDIISFDKDNSGSFIEFYPEIIKLIFECKNKINEPKE